MMSRPPTSPHHWSRRLNAARLLRLRLRWRELSGRWLPVLRRSDHVFIVIVAVLLGVAGAYGAIAFRELVRLAHWVFFGSDQYAVALLEAIPWWRRLLQPAAGGLLVGIIVTFAAPEVRGSGIPEVMEAVARRGGAIRARVVVTKALAAALTIASGGSAGREGPVVHIGAAIASYTGQLLQVSARRLRTFVACGTAAAIAATFNAPIAGALFAVEVVLGDLAVAHLSPIVISSVVATVVSRHYLGDFPAFRVPQFQLVHPRELVLYGLLGVLAALLGVLFIRVLFGLGDLFERSRLPAWLRPALGGLAVGIIALAFPHVYGVGYESINAALWGELDGLWLLVALLIAKGLATAFTLGSGGSGGVFAPSLFLGAVLGAAWGGAAHSIFPQWTGPAAAYALVGMGAMVAATTHAPITAILIIFELTNDYRIIPPLMLSCVLGVLLSGLLYRDSIYTAKLSRRGVRWQRGRDVNVLRNQRVQDVMSTNPPIVSAALPFSELVPQLLSGKHMELLVVDRDRRLLGIVGLADIRAAVPDSSELAQLVLTADVADTTVPFVIPNDGLDVVMKLMDKVRGEYIPVCEDSSHRKVIGMVTRSQVTGAYNRLVAELDLSEGFQSMAASVATGRQLEVADGVQLTEIDVPQSLVGLSLRRARLRQQYDVEVVLIRHRVEGVLRGELPDAKAVLQSGDRLLVVGKNEAIERLVQ